LGIKFTRGYVSSSICTPSRAGILTGKHAFKFGIHGNASSESINYNSESSESSESSGSSGLPRNEMILPEYLQEYGYKTALFGKWHLGSGANFLPVNRGFDIFYGILEGGSSYNTAFNPKLI
jgi:arylsulfatase A-like enzyme